MSVTIQLRRDTAANWTAVNSVLHQGEIGIETDTGKGKAGDGVTAWNSLAYWQPSGADTDSFLPLTGGTMSGVIAMGSSKVTGLANGTAGSDAAAFGQTPAGGNTVTTGQGGTGSTTRNFAGLLTPTAVKTTTYSAAAGDYVPCDTTSGGFTVTLPNAPADLTVVGVKMVIQGGTNTVTVACAGSDVYNKTGGATSATLTLLAQGILLQYKASGGIWYVLADDLALTQLDGRYVPQATLTTLGDILYENSTPAPARLAGNTTGTKNYLTQTGTGTVSAAPAWGTIAAADLPTGTTSTKGALQLDGTAGDIAASPGTAAAGATGKAADAAHVHPQPAVFAPTGLTGATAASRYVGATTTGPPVTGTFATGDWFPDQGGVEWVCTAGGTPGTWALAGAQTLSELYLRSAATLGETIPRRGMLNTATTPSSGVLRLMAVALPKGVTVGHLAYAGVGAASAPTHWWFGLYDSSLAQLAVTADQTSTAWAGNTYQSLAIATIASGASSTFTTTYTGLYYMGFMMTAGTATTLAGGNWATSSLTTPTPVLTGDSTGSLTTPPAFPFTGAALSAVAYVTWGAVLT